jgi:hypothetical protein
VVLAQAEDIDVTDNDHLFVILGKDSFANDLCERR